MSITVPAGYTSVHLQALTAPPKGRSAPGVKPPGPEWKTVASKLTNSQAGLVQLNAPKLTSRRNLRVFGLKPELPARDQLGNLTAFPADPETGQAGGPILSLGGTNAGLSFGNTTSIASADTGSSTSTTREVSESDIWKIDGDRLYFYNSVRGLQVFDIANPDRPVLLGTLTMPGAGEQMYLLDPDHAVLLRNENYWWSWYDWDFRWSIGTPIVANTGGISLLTTSNATLTLSASAASIQSALTLVRSNPFATTHSVVVVDVSQGTPVALAELPFSGYLLESRLVGQVLYIASNTYYAMQADGTYGTGTLVTSYDLADPAHPVERASVFTPGWANVVTATDQYFFVSTSWGYPANVQIFDISDPHGAIVKAGQVGVPGCIADKFKIDQRGTTMTVVSAGWRTYPDLAWDSFSTVSTFSLADPLHPVPLGSLDGPRGEQLYATRFEGSRLYMVTAVRNWDPLFIIDLSKPEKPVVLGSVEMPGFSTFIHPLGDRLVATGVVAGKPTVDLYDVSDPTAPILRSRVSLAQSNQGAYTEATWNEKAFNVLPESNLVLLPLSTYGADGSFTGVQLIDLLPDRLVKRGGLNRKFLPRRAGMHGTRILSISANELVTVNADDRDHPVVTSDVEISWPVDRTFLAGSWLLELGGNQWGNSAPTLTVAPANSPDATTATLALPNQAILSATMRNGVLYVLQGEWKYNLIGPAALGQTFNGTSLTLSSIDVSQLPGVSLLGQVTVDRVSTDNLAFSDLKPLWVNDRTLLFSLTASNSFYSIPRLWPIYYTTNSVTLTAASSASVASLADSSLSILPSISIWTWNNTTELFAFNVDLPSQPKYASHLKIGKDEGWQVSAPLTVGDKVYLSYKVVPSNALKPPAPGAPDPLNRYFLKVIDYSNSAAPVEALRGVNVPGELRAVAPQGDLLYTVGPLISPADGKVKGGARAVHASSFDGAAAHLLDQLPLDVSTQPLLVTGDAVLLLHPQPASSARWDFATGTYATNTAPTTLDAWSLGNDGKFTLSSTLTLDHELSLGQVRNLGVLRSNDASVRLLDLSDPLHPSDLGTHAIHANGTSSIGHADGEAKRGLWLPLGAYGVEVISLDR